MVGMVGKRTSVEELQALAHKETTRLNPHLRECIESSLMNSWTESKLRVLRENPQRPSYWVGGRCRVS